MNLFTMPADLGAWGRVPIPIIEAVQTLSRTILLSGQHLEELDWPEAPSDIQDLLHASVADAHRSARASTDMRALLTAYAHRFHQPRPILADLARAQDSTPQGLARRYSNAHVDGLNALLDTESPNIEAILSGFPSLTLSDLTRFTGAVGAAATRTQAQKAQPPID